MPSEIILENQNMIYKMSTQFYGVDREDLIQAGFLGLTKAYKKFNPNMGTKFSTYAYGFIHGEMYETAMGNRPIRLRKNEMKVYKGVIKIKELLEAKENRSVSYEEACAYMSIDYNLFLSILNSLAVPTNIEDASLSLQSRETSTDDMIMLRDSLASLTPLEKNVMMKRYMDDRSQEETAKILGLSQVKVSRIEKKSRDKMRNFMTN